MTGVLFVLIFVAIIFIVLINHEITEAKERAEHWEQSRREAEEAMQQTIAGWGEEDDKPNAN